MTNASQKKPYRRKLPDCRPGKSIKMQVGIPAAKAQMSEFLEDLDSLHPTFIKAFVTTGEYEDGTLGEVFIQPDKEGSLLRGMADGFGIMLSLALQHGIPLETIVRKFINTRFEPSGMTNDPQIPIAKSFFDLLFRKLALLYLDKDACFELGIEKRTQNIDDYRKTLERESKEEIDAQEEDWKVEGWRCIETRPTKAFPKAVKYYLNDGAAAYRQVAEEQDRPDDDGSDEEERCPGGFERGAAKSPDGMSTLQASL